MVKNITFALYFAFSACKCTTFQAVNEIFARFFSKKMYF